MRKRIASLALLVVLLAYLGCGGGSSKNNLFGGGTGTVVLVANDQPACNVSSFQVTITGISLVPQGTGSAVNLLSSSQPVTVDLASLMDLTTLLGQASVPSGTYSQIAFTLSNPQLTLPDYTKTPPVPQIIPVALPALTVTYDINPAVTVTANQTAGVEVDFNLLKSVETDTNGNVTGNATLVASAGAVSPATGTGFARLENLHGLVQSISTSASGTFTGSLVLQTSGIAGGPTVTVNATNSTVINGVTGGLGSIIASTFAEIDAYLDSSGNIVATRITAEEQERTGTRHAGFVGKITSVTRLATGAVSQFTLLVQEEFPDVSSSVPLQSSLPVTVQSTTALNIVAPEDNAANLTFDATAIGVGQDATVHGTFVPGTTPTMTASSVDMRVQTVVGNFTSVLTAGLDGKTGGFAFTPCSGIFQGQRISALTFSTTGFDGVLNLNSLTTPPRSSSKVRSSTNPRLRPPAQLPSPRPRRCWSPARCTNCLKEGLMAAAGANDSGQTGTHTA